MKPLFRFFAFVAAVAFVACDNFDQSATKFDNVVFLDVSKTSEVQPTTFNNMTPVLERSLQANLAFPVASDTEVSLAVDPSLVAAYNARFRTDWPMLDSKFYELSADRVVIPAGKTVSDVVTLRLHDLMGQGEQQEGALPINETYLLPVRIARSSMAVLDGSDVAYYVVKRSSAITVAAQLTDNWIEFPSLDKYSPGSMIFNGLTAVTYEALVYFDEFAKQNPQGAPVSISSLMGVEQYLLLRVGDTNFERQQLQFDGSGSGAGFGKFPGSDVTKNLEPGRWYHIACTYDQAARTVRIFVDGQIQSEAVGVGVSTQSEENRINLAMRALYNLWDTASEADKPQYEDKKYNTLAAAYQFFIGRSYDDYRPLNGKIAEARVWSVARTPEQIWECMYDVENPKDDPTLIGYWKFNENKGNTIKDYSKYGNDGVAKYDIVWPAGIEIPEINKTEE